MVRTDQRTRRTAHRRSSIPECFICLFDSIYREGEADFRARMGYLIPSLDKTFAVGVGKRGGRL